MDELLTSTTQRAIRYLKGLDERPVAAPPEALARLPELGGPMPPGPSDPAAVLAILDDAQLREPRLDLDRCGVTGFSYGGYMTNRAITVTDRFRDVHRGERVHRREIGDGACDLENSMIRARRERQPCERRIGNGFEPADGFFGRHGSRPETFLLLGGGHDREGRSGFSSRSDQSQQGPRSNIVVIDENVVPLMSRRNGPLPAPRRDPSARCCGCPGASATLAGPPRRARWCVVNEFDPTRRVGS